MAGEFSIRDGVLESYGEKKEWAAIPEGVHTIGEGAFKGCVSLKKVELPHTLCYILPNAFKGCRKLEEVRIPEGVKMVGDYAFHRCHALKKIALPPSVEELGHCAFLYCDGLEEVRIPGVKRLGRQVFLNDVRLKKLEICQGLFLGCICDVFTGCGKLEEISFAGGETCVFPNVVEAVAGGAVLPPLVKAVAADVLRMMELDGRRLVRFLTNLKHVEVPEGIISIGKSCFFDKRGILSVKLPRSLQEIESRAFRNCINLETVMFSGDPQSIHEDAFKNCTSLKQVQTADGLWHELSGIGGAAHGHKPKLVRRIHGQVLGNFRISGKVLLKYLGGESRVVVPEGIEVIAEEAFAGNEAIDRVILPESLKKIGAGAFRGCLLLQAAPLPQNLEQVGAGAFENCFKLIRAILPPKVADIGPAAFKRCSVLKEAVLGESVKTIGEQAFYGCLSLRQVNLPQNIKAIGAMAFYRCKALEEIHIPAQTECVGDLAFAQSGLKRVCLSGSGRHYGAGVFSGCLRLESATLEEGVRHIGDKMFYGCNALGQMTLPDSLESVGKFVVEKTPFLEGRRQGQGGFAPGCVFWDGRGLEGEVWLPRDLRILAGGAFYGNENVTGIHLPEGLEWVGPAAFKGCTALENVFWPASVETVEEEVFDGCGALTSVETSGKWRRIGQRAFYGCRQLRSLGLQGVKQVGKEAFCGCKSLEMASIEPPLHGLLWFGERAMEGTPMLHVQEEGWAIIAGVLLDGSACRGEVRIPEGVTAIGPFAFEGNQAITKLSLPDSLSRIGEGAFWGCGCLENVLFPEKEVVLEARAFEKCISLKEVSVYSSQVGQGAFAYCLGLERATFFCLTALAPRTFEGCQALARCVLFQGERVEAGCFCGCKSLQDFSFPDLRYVGEYAFENCDGLTKAEFTGPITLCPHAFQDCGRLKEIVLTGDLGDVDLREYAFSGCTALEVVCQEGRGWRFSSYSDVLSEEVPELARMFFYSAMSCFTVEKETDLKGYKGSGHIVRIPQGICRIGAEVFQNQLMLEEIEFPPSLQYIGPRAFHGTAWMERQRQVSPMVAVNHMLLDGSGCEGQVEIPEDIRMVCGWAFANGLKIEKLSFPPSKVRVEEHAFRNCIHLKEAVLPDGSVVRIEGVGDRKKGLAPLAKQIVTEALNCCKTDSNDVLVECTGNIPCLCLPNGITAIGEGAFQDSNLLTEVIFPLTVASVEKKAFAGCKWLRAVRQAQSIRRVGPMAFMGCGSLERVELSGALQVLEARAFENCISLKEIQIPEGVEEIPDKAFYRCHSLGHVRLPSTLKRIGKEAFAFCRSMEKPDLPEGVLVEERAFAGIKTG